MRMGCSGGSRGWFARVLLRGDDRKLLALNNGSGNRGVEERRKHKDARADGLASADLVEACAGFVDLVVDFDLPAHTIEFADLMRTVRLARQIGQEEAIALGRGDTDQAATNADSAPRPTVTSASMACPSSTTMSSSKSASKSAPSASRESAEPRTRRFTVGFQLSFRRTTNLTCTRVALRQSARCAHTPGRSGDRFHDGLVDSIRCGLSCSLAGVIL